MHPDKKHTGQTFVGFINAQKLNRAALLLSSTDLPVREIASELGFESANYFTKLFAKHYGCVPVQYRKKKAAEMSG